MAKPVRKKMNLKKVTEKAKESNFGSISWANKPGDTRIYKMKKGKNNIIIVPFEVTMKNNPDDIDVGELWYGTLVKVHTNIGANGESILCPSTFGKPCPICEHRKSLMDEGMEWNDEEVSKLSPRKRQLFNIINVDDDDSSVQLMESSFKNFGELLETEVRDDENNAVFADPDDGLILQCRGVEKTFGKNKYIAIDKITFEKREESLTDEDMEGALDLHAILKLLPYDEIYQKFHIGGEEPEPEETPQKPSRFKKPKREEVEEEEEEETSEEETEEEEESEEESTEEEETSESSDEKCEFFGKKCDYDEDVCEDCDDWAECRKLTDKRLKEKRSK